jgi:hypothetical protein
LVRDGRRVARVDAPGAADHHGRRGRAAARAGAAGGHVHDPGAAAGADELDAGRVLQVEVLVGDDRAERAAERVGEAHRVAGGGERVAPRPRADRVGEPAPGRLVRVSRGEQHRRAVEGLATLGGGERGPRACDGGVGWRLGERRGGGEQRERHRGAGGEAGGDSETHHGWSRKEVENARSLGVRPGVHILQLTGGAVPVAPRPGPRSSVRAAVKPTA